ncbi:MAG: glycine--tRNA ligase subunit beta [Endomicrobium sp.]|jgi:glycyl-tRNA synthetase beta chain|nr:glycine--tRNA ligase subunit beta [Endomicrobium sp.]
MIKENKKTALLEIGTEELPYLYIKPVLEQMQQIARKHFNSLGLRYSKIKTYATPRRLVMLIDGLAEKSEDRVEEILGPALKVAKDSNGNYTRAALEFALKNDVLPEKLVKKVTERGDYFSFTKRNNGEKTENILAFIFLEVIKNLSFPKTMMWEESSFKFARPIRNIIALYGKKIIKFKVAGVSSSNWTIGLHVYDASKVKIDFPENYFLKMKNKSVIVDQNERCNEIKRIIELAVKDVGSVILDESLIDEVNYLVEYPTAILCTFDKKYLNLPQEVLAICMKKSQKCFAVNDKNGKFSNYFIGIKNGISSCQEIVREGYEKVIAARLADAEFFYLNDLKNGLKNNIEKLKCIIFHDEIGTIYEKLERIKQIVKLLNKEFNMQIDDTLLKKAVELSKTDLVSEMIFEYPELRGVMGKIYALKLGESFCIAESIEQHYYPLSASGTLPSNKIAVLISLADRIDTLSAMFSIGLETYGSADPYGLRRIAIGFIRIMIENLAIANLPIKNLSSIIGKVFEFLPENLKNNSKSKNAYEKLINFFWQKIESIFELQGYSYYEIKAVVNSSRINKSSSLSSIKSRLIALKNARKRDNFLAIATVFKRINNIINRAKKQNVSILEKVDRTLLIENSEKTLFFTVKEAKDAIANYVLKDEYDKVFDKILDIKPLIDDFFEKVIVMSEEKSLKFNRISLLNYIKNMFDGFIDFSALQ